VLELFTNLERKEWVYDGERKNMVIPSKTFTSAEEDKYRKDVQSYTSYLIGKKINENVPKYTER